MKTELPLLLMEKILKLSGAKRVSENAKTEFRNILKKKAHEISKKAIVFSKHSGRKTTQTEDIALAIEN